MKKLYALILKKIFPLLLLVFSQAREWAIDTTTEGTIDNSTNILTQPWIWIGIGVLLAVILLGPSTREKDFYIVRKKNSSKQ